MKEVGGPGAELASGLEALSVGGVDLGVMEAVVPEGLKAADLFEADWTSTKLEALVNQIRLVRNSGDKMFAAAFAPVPIDRLILASLPASS